MEHPLFHYCCCYYYYYYYYIVLFQILGLCFRQVGGDLNSGLVLARWRLFKSDSNNGPSPGHLDPVSDGVTSVQVSYLLFPDGCHIWPRTADLTSIMA